jgi:hypothetical protein
MPSIFRPTPYLGNNVISPLSLSLLRLWTRGYDTYSPTRPIIAHDTAVNRTTRYPIKMTSDIMRVCVLGHSRVIRLEVIWNGAARPSPPQLWLTCDALLLPLPLSLSPSLWFSLLQLRLKRLGPLSNECGLSLVAPLSPPLSLPPLPLTLCHSRIRTARWKQGRNVSPIPGQIWTRDEKVFGSAHSILWHRFQSRCYCHWKVRTERRLENSACRSVCMNCLEGGLMLGVCAVRCKALSWVPFQPDDGIGYVWVMLSCSFFPPPPLFVCLFVCVYVCVSRSRV